MWREPRSQLLFSHTGTHNLHHWEYQIRTSISGGNIESDISNFDIFVNIDIVSKQMIKISIYLYLKNKKKNTLKQKK